MGDFIVYRADKIDNIMQYAMVETLSAQGSKNPKIIQDDSYNIILYEKNISPIANFIRHDNGDYCASSGCFFYKGKNGRAALTDFLYDFTPNQYSPYNFMGVFSLIIKKQGRLFIITDPMGASRIFHDNDHHIWSSSFLCLAENLKSLSVDKQGLYEYCFCETNYGQSSIFNEIKTADSLCYFELCQDGIKPHLKNIPLNYDLSTLSFDELVDQQADLLQYQMQNIISCYGSKISTALSGGYDTRLMLSLLQNEGNSPNLYVYGSDDSADVKVAKSIANGEGASLNHINKASWPKTSPDQYRKIVKDNFYSLDGYPNEGIFDFGANMATRRERATDGTLVLNGGGGEIYRNFFYLPDGNYRINDLINVFYSRYTADYCSDKFNEHTYRKNLHDKISTALILKDDHMTRSQIEYAYPAFRLRYWTAKDNSNNTRLGSFLTPFICYETITSALKIPLKYKNHGKFQGALINRISPRLAAYMTDYGYPLNKDVPLKNKIKNNLTIYRPAFLRRYSYAIQQKMAVLHLPEHLKDDYIKTVLPNGTSYMSEYFEIDKIKDAALLGRVLTLEYLFNHLNV